MLVTYPCGVGGEPSLRGTSLAEVESSGVPETHSKTVAPGIKQLGRVRGNAS